jgi:hypothetical protein
MMSVSAPLAPLLIQGVAAARETVYVKAVGPDLGVLGDIQAVSTAIIMLVMVLILVAIVFVALQVRRAQRQLVAALERIYADAKPLVQRASSIADNVNAISAVIRRDVDRIGATVADADERVRRAISATEAKLHELSAVLAVAQEEAEDLFVSTASTVRGVRSGAAAFSRRDGPDLASEELDAADLAEDTETSEEPNGDDDSSESPTTSLSAAPRIRPRVGGRRRA